MTDKRDQEQEEPKIKVVDRRVLSDDERAGVSEESGSEAEVKAEAGTERPKLEIIGGGSSKTEASQKSTSEPAEDESAAELGDDAEISDEERDKLREEIEQEQFAALEQQMGRPLTSQEKEQVRSEMKKQAETAARLEVEPLLVQLMAEMSARAAVHLGLMPNPYTQIVARNDAQARTAIDAYGAVYNVVKDQLDDRMRKELERVLNDLRVNYSSITGTPASIFDSGDTGFGGPRIIH